MKKTQMRRRIPQLRVPVLASEKTDIERNATSCGLPVAAYLRSLGLGYKPKGVLDANSILELAKVNGDLGRLGGLLKMLLTNDGRLQALGKEQVLPTIHGILEEIRVTQGLLFEAAKKI